jgi:hypothetical protein
MNTSGLLLVCVLAFVQYSYATMCIECATTSVLSVAECEDKYDPVYNAKFLKNCTYGCSKTEAESNGVAALMRGCALKEEKEDCESKEASAFGLYAKTVECYCNTDECNGAGQMMLSVSAIFSVIVVAIRSMF